MHENEIGKYIVDKAVRIHRDMGPGLLELVYEVILAHQLRQQGPEVERQRAIPIEYTGSGSMKDGIHRTVNHLIE